MHHDLLHPLRGLHGVLFDLMRHANACFACPSPRRSGICLSSNVDLSDVCAFVPDVSPIQERVHQHQLEFPFAIRFLCPQLFDLPGPSPARAALLFDAMVASSCIPI